MKGLLFIIIIYGLAFLGCAVIKFLLNKSNKKSSSDTPTAKIYYVTKNSKKVKKPNSVIPISATVIEKQKIND